MKEKSLTEGALAAMVRAAEVARERAIRFGSPLVRWIDGTVVLVDPVTNQPIPNSDDPAEDVTDAQPEGKKEEKPPASD